MMKTILTASVSAGTSCASRLENVKEVLHCWWKHYGPDCSGGGAGALAEHSPAGGLSGPERIRQGGILVSPV